MQMIIGVILGIALMLFIAWVLFKDTGNYNK